MICATRLTGDGDASSLRPSHSGDASPIDARLLDLPILVVEDEAVIAWTLESLLEDMGFTDIEIVADARGAVASAAARVPGLIVSDINLGAGDDGVAAAAAIHAAGFVPTLFVTGYAAPEMRARIERDVAGAAVLRKPVEPGPLRRAVVEALGRGAAN